MKIKIRIYGDNLFISFRDLKLQEYGVECESFKVVSFD